jgi:hypothetical protein
VYDNIHDADMRLTGTIIRYKGAAHLVKNVYPHNDKYDVIAVRLIPCKKSKLVPPHIDTDLKDKDLDISSPPLGYIPFPFGWGMGWAYAVRMPARRQQQGVVLNRVAIYLCGKPYKPARNYADLTGIADCIAGNYPSIEKFTEGYANHYPDSVFPLSREIAVSTNYLYYKAHVVGVIRKEKDCFNVTITSPSFRYYYFKEVFHEDWRFSWA